MLLLSRFKVITAMFADRTLIVGRKFRTVEGFEVTADLADEAFLLFDLDSRNVFEGIFSVFAQRANVIIRQVVPFIEIPADRAAPAFFLFRDRGFLGLDMGMIVGIGRARGIRQRFGFNDIGDEQR